MVFSDSTNKQGLVELARRRTKLDSSQYTIEDVTGDINMALDEFVSIAITADGKWKFDGTQHSDYPIASKNIVASQEDYVLSDGTTEFLAIQRVEAQDEDGDWYVLDQIDTQDVIGKPLSQLFNAEGKAQYYDLTGNAIRLYPTPSANITGGLKIFYKRNVQKFEPSDTTQEPGIPSIFQPWLGMYAAYQKAISEDLTNANELLKYVEDKKMEIKDYYSRRDQSRNIRLRSVKRSFK